jgi:hypothetical protein
MSHVVEFLQRLCVDESNGAVRRMLKICAEFERISKIVLDKSDRDSSSRRKRKPQEADPKQSNPAMHTPRMPVATPNTMMRSGSIASAFSPAANMVCTP